MIKDITMPIACPSSCVIGDHSTDNDVTSGYIQLETNQLRMSSQQITDKFKELLEIEDVAKSNQ